MKSDTVVPVIIKVILILAAVFYSIQAISEESETPKKPWEELGAPPPAKVEPITPDIVIDYGNDNNGNPRRGEFYIDEFTGQYMRMNPQTSGEWWPHLNNQN